MLAPRHSRTTHQLPESIPLPHPRITRLPLRKLSASGQKPAAKPERDGTMGPCYREKEATARQGTGSNTRPKKYLPMRACPRVYYYVSPAPSGYVGPQGRRRGPLTLRLPPRGTRRRKAARPPRGTAASGEARRPAGRRPAHVGRRGAILGGARGSAEGANTAVERGGGGGLPAPKQPSRHAPRRGEGGPPPRQAQGRRHRGGESTARAAGVRAHGSQQAESPGPRAQRGGGHAVGRAAGRLVARSQGGKRELSCERAELLSVQVSG